MLSSELLDLVIDALEDRKVSDICVLDVHQKTSVTDNMVIATGSSSRQVKSAADNVIERAKLAGIKPLGVEGEREAQWVLVDLGDVVVHIMQADTREFYQLEKLWSTESDLDSQAL